MVFKVLGNYNQMLAIIDDVLEYKKCTYTCWTNILFWRHSPSI